MILATYAIDDDILTWWVMYSIMFPALVAWLTGLIVRREMIHKEDIRWAEAEANARWEVVTRSSGDEHEMYRDARPGGFVVVEARHVARVDDRRTRVLHRVEVGKIPATSSEFDAELRRILAQGEKIAASLNTPKELL